MGESKHTPGPWDVTTVDHSSGGGGATPSTLFRVGFLSQKDFTGHVADKCHGDSYANARLIAAAPDLLAFAKRVMADHRAKLPSEARDLYGGGCGCPQCEQAAAAIQKAEGK